MKQSNIFVITLLSILALNLCTNLLRTEKAERKKKSKTTYKAKSQDYGSGTWDTGYTCPEIQIALGKGTLKNEGEGTFQAKNLDNPVAEDDKLGWKFVLKNAPGSTLQKVMFKGTGNNSYYIPWRIISSYFTYTNPAGDNKYLTGFIINDAGETFQLKVLLPYKTLGWYIDDNEGQKLCNLLARRRNEAHNAVLAIKANAISAATSYISDKSLYDSALQNQNNISKALNEINAKITETSNTITSTESTRNQASLAYTSALSNLKAKESELNQLNSDLNALSTKYDSNAETLRQLSANNGNATEQIKGLQTTVDKSKQVFDQQITTLKSQAKERNSEIDAVVTANNNLQSEGVKSNLQKIFPNRN